VNTSDGSVSVSPGTTGGKKSFVIDVIDGSEAIRAYIPTGEVLTVGEMVFQNGEPIGFDVTVTAYVD
jgi:hypothetical protein